MLPYLPVDIDDPVDRLQVVHARIRELQAGHEPLAGGSLTTLAAYGPFVPCPRASGSGCGSLSGRSPP